jgi:hypothetical protein
VSAIPVSGIFKTTISRSEASGSRVSYQPKPDRHQLDAHHTNQGL